MLSGGFGEPSLVEGGAALPGRVETGEVVGVVEPAPCGAEAELLPDGAVEPDGEGVGFAGVDGPLAGEDELAASLAEEDALPARVLAVASGFFSGGFAAAALGADVGLDGPETIEHTSCNERRTNVLLYSAAATKC